ncbi:DUF4003 family protein [Listeria goaensis]|uniref:DUF4003 family protein n=1 Tax=Listeria goaensis TaxID=1649188 RepID=UPI000B58B620|nr:DUF4003 family protein [Listeria goaensis]
MANELSYVDELTQLLSENYERIRKSKVNFVDKRIRFLIARLFTGKNELVDAERFFAADRAIKSELGFFIALNGNVRASLAGLLVADGTDDRSDVLRLIQHYRELVEVKFGRSEFTYFAAYLLLKQENADSVATAKRAKEIYTCLKKFHPFLTGPEDATASVMLASLDTSLSAQEIADIVEFYFQEFADLDFHKNNGLQALAATAALLYGKKDRIFVTRVRTLLNELDKKGIKVKELYYNTIGILAYVNDGAKLDAHFFELVSELSQVSGLKFFGKTFYTALALSLYTEEVTGKMNQAQIENLMVSVHVLIAIEQASAAAAAAAASAAAANSSSN